MGRFGMVLLALASAVFVPAEATAYDPCYNFDGSTVRVIDRGGRFSITFDEPSEDLQAAGVRPGSVLVFGTSSNGALYGTARHYAQGCVGRPDQYVVTGGYQQDYSIILNGVRDVRDECRATGSTVADELSFSFLGPCR
ncbi:MAG: hypothetical protein AAGJ94_03795 [Pseudomonadota bacterium]